MKVEVKNKVSFSEIKYPCLMISTDLYCIVLFNECECGTCIYNGKTNNEIGKYYEKWDMDSFVPFNGEVILKND